MKDAQKAYQHIKTLRELNRHARRLKAIMYALKYPSKFKQIVREGIGSLYEYGYSKKNLLPTLSLEKVVQTRKEITLSNFEVRNGNVSYLELLILASVTAIKEPKNLLEIGTFDGNTTLQLALNSPEEAFVHTIDLPEENAQISVAILEDDLLYVIDEKKKSKKYLNTNVEGKVIQHFGDSTLYDFQKFCVNGLIDFCFIDGGHSYECVKSDSEKAIKILSQDGIILWHDYSPNCPGVYRYINELSKSYAIWRFEGTSLVIYSKSEQSFFKSVDIQ